MNKHDIRIVALTLLMILSFALSGKAYNMRQTISGDGLSNSAILSMCLDSNGYLWIGTCDGVNISDGKNIHTFQSLFPGRALSGNIIEMMKKGSDQKMWILTNYGLDLFDAADWSLTTFHQFHGQEQLFVADNGKTFVLSEDAHIYMHDAENPSAGFIDLGTVDLPDSGVRCLMVRDGNLWMVTASGLSIYNLPSKTTSGSGALKVVKKITDIHPRFAKANQDLLLLITEEGDLCEVDADGSVIKITSIAHALAGKGKISDIIRDRQGNYFISFSTDGALWVGLNEEKEFMAIDLGLHVGVFCLAGSPVQDVVWIGSDCQGIYTFWDDRYNIHSYDFNDFDNKLSHPVRAIFLDDSKNLWIGTKGDGLLRIPGVDQDNPRRSLDKGYLFTSSNSELRHNSVFAISGSKRPILWIGSDEGLNYYSYASNKIVKIGTEEKIRFIHAIYEENDTTLWLCSLGNGVIKVTLAPGTGLPEITDVTIYSLDEGKLSSNAFFSLTVTDDGRILFCNRGRGVFEVKEGSLQAIPFKSDFGTNLVNDVFVAIQDKDVLWLGTGYGLIKSWPEGEKHFYGEADGFANNTIHDMLRVESGDLWISTNAGIVNFHPEQGRGVTYGEKYGLNVTEYSEGAAFYNGKGMIFGGINGLTFIAKHLTYTAPPEYKPRLSFMTLSISGEEMPMFDYLKMEGGQATLVLDPDENYFSVRVAAPDFIDAHNYVYSYSLDGANWINNGPETSISFNGMAYGTYTLTVKYMNRVTGIESEPSKLKIIVKAPWYLSGWAKAFYLLLAVLLILAGVWLYIRRQREKQKEEMKKLEQAHKEDLYEEKLRFFTNITHEFCTPLTLIYGPCERILNYPGSDDYIKRYVGLVRTNAERLNTLIQELIDFRRMETGNKRLKLSQVGVSEVCSDIISSFAELADRNSINLINEIKPGIEWVTDFGCLRKIVTNLISNAFKYTPTGGTIKISLDVVDGRLRISVYNTGKGISEEEKLRIFNRYSVLDNVEENAVKGLSSRNGLGLAICHSMVDMLNGSISIESEVGSYADFIVDLPPLQLSESKADAGSSAPVVTVSSPSSSLSSVSSSSDQSENSQPESVIPDIPSPSVSPSKTGEDGKDRVLVVDDNPEILLLLRDALSDFDVEAAESADKALDIIRQTPPDLIVSDIMMPGIDGVKFTKMVKQNRHTMHIPLVLLSAKTSSQEKVEGLESGADAYIGKPFSVDYLKAVVKRLLENRRYLREYYTTGASTFEYTEGKLMHKEDKEFMARIAAFVDEHVEDEDLGPEKLAAHMTISVRNLYRKFKELDQMSPNDFIKYRRISFAARLLVTSSATVQEIIYRSGFTNRSHFYKEFDKRFGMTPKSYRAANASKDISLEAADDE